MTDVSRKPEVRESNDLADHRGGGESAGRGPATLTLVLSVLQMAFSIPGLVYPAADLFSISPGRTSSNWALITASFGPAAILNLTAGFGSRRGVQLVTGLICVCCYLPLLQSLYQTSVLQQRWATPSAWFVFAAMAGLWSVLAAISSGIVKTQPEAIAHRQQIREQQLILVAAAVCSAAESFEIPFLRFVPAAIGLYLIALGLEVLLRTVFSAVAGTGIADHSRQPLLTRSLLFGQAPRVNLSAGQLAAATFDIRRPVVSALASTVFIGWLSTGVTIVSVEELALYYRNGHQVEHALAPGLHLHLPVPFGRTKKVPARRVQVTTVGYLLDAQRLSQQKYLWTESHGDKEVSFVVGDGTEVVAINAIVQHCPKTTVTGLQQYITLADSPEEIVRRTAMNVLLSESRTLNVAQLLTMNRSEWSQRLHERLSSELDHRNLGIEIKCVDVVSVHPPVEIAAAYLEIIDANVRAEAEVIEARGAHESELSRSRMMADTTIADATAAASVRLTGVAQEVEQLKALTEVAGNFRTVFERHAWCNAVSDALSDREIILLGTDVSSGVRLILGSDAPAGDTQK
ncbi:MAG: hypothetical protein JNM43_07100 [Planctomycetaceae bacterium]|nr:hypothetical protein [Planctomycetaceae bacterium]